MNGLQLGTSEAGDVVLPIEAATTVIAIVGTRGAGKTETGTVLCEELYDAGVPWVAIDPLGVMHGLRSSFDGKSAGLAVSILGGAHGDVPLQPTAGAAVADLVVDRPGHYVLDLSDFDTDAENDRFAEQFAHRLIRAKARAPFAMHLIVDEADTFIPQQPFPGQQRDAGRFQRAGEAGQGARRRHDADDAAAGLAEQEHAVDGGVPGGDEADVAARPGRGRGLREAAPGGVRAPGVYEGPPLVFRGAGLAMGAALARGPGAHPGAAPADVRLERDAEGRGATYRADGAGRGGYRGAAGGDGVDGGRGGGLGPEGAEGPGE